MPAYFCGCCGYEPQSELKTLDGKTTNEIISLHGKSVGSIIALLLNNDNVFAEERQEFLKHICAITWASRNFKDSISVFNYLNKYVTSNNEGVSYVILTFLENEFWYLEHGSSIRHPWLSDSGKKFITAAHREAAVKELNTYGFCFEKSDYYSEQDEAEEETTNTPASAIQ